MTPTLKAYRNYIVILCLTGLILLLIHLCMMSNSMVGQWLNHLYNSRSGTSTKQPSAAFIIDTLVPFGVLSTAIAIIFTPGSIIHVLICNLVTMIVLTLAGVLWTHWLPLPLWLAYAGRRGPSIFDGLFFAAWSILCWKRNNHNRH